MIKKYFLKLYIADDRTILSRTVIRNFNKIILKKIRNEYTLEIIDISRQPLKGEEEKIVATPTLIKIMPSPVIRFVGDLSNEENILAHL